MQTIAQATRRPQLQSSSTRFVEPLEYLSLIVSPRNYWRADDAQAGLRGLWDPANNEWLVVEESKLQRHERTHRREA